MRAVALLLKPHYFCATCAALLCLQNCQMDAAKEATACFIWFLKKQGIDIWLVHGKEKKKPTNALFTAQTLLMMCCQCNSISHGFHIVVTTGSIFVASRTFSSISFGIFTFIQLWTFFVHLAMSKSQKNHLWFGIYIASYLFSLVFTFHNCYACTAFAGALRFPSAMKFCLVSHGCQLGDSRKVVVKHKCRVQAFEARH